MKPVLGEIFGLQIYGYGTALAVAFLSAVILGILFGRKKGYNPDFVMDTAIVGCLGGLVGARLVYILLNLREYLSYPLSFLDIQTGFSFVGGLAGGVLAGVVFVRLRKKPVWPLADVAALCIPVAYAIGRVGCLLRGCCYGIETVCPWGLAAGPGPILRHPTQIYSILGGLLIFLILWLQRNHRRFDGFLFAQFFVLYSVERFIIEYFREGTPFLAGLTITQVSNILTGAAALAAIILFERRRLKGERPSHGMHDEDVQG